MPARTSKLWRFIAVVGPLPVFAFFSVAIFGHEAVGSLTTRTVGAGGDFHSYVWFFSWWPHAIAAGINPLNLDVVFSPVGIPAHWTTAMPTLALVFWPITHFAGPVVAVNVAYLLAPALSAWTAYLLCRELTGKIPASLVGGVLFGFGAFVGSHMIMFLNITFVPVIPLVGLVGLRLARGTLGRWLGVLLFGILLALQIGISSEIALLATVFGCVLLTLAWLLEPSSRVGVRRILPVAVLGWILGSLLAAPIVVSQLLAGDPGWHPARRQDSADLVNLVIPDAASLVSFASGISNRFTSAEWERGSYISLLGVIVLVVLFVGYRALPGTKIVAAGALSAWLLCLSPLLRIAGHEVPVPTPSILLTILPVTRFAIPGRFALFLGLMVCVAAALLLARVQSRRYLTWGLVVAAMVAVLPNPLYPLRSSSIAQAPLALSSTGSASPFTGETIVLVPVVDGMRWQAESGFAFNLVGGYTGVILPETYRPWRDVLDDLREGRVPPPERMSAYLDTFHANVVVVANGASPGLDSELRGLGFHGTESDGVGVFRR